MQPHMMNEFKASFSSYLTDPKWKWNWVVTQTFDTDKVPLHRSIVRESWQDMLGKIGKNSSCCYGWVFGETGRMGRVHWHAILHVQENLFGDPSRRQIWEQMFDKYGRCSITAYVCNQREIGNIATKTISDGIARYLTKYVVKDTFSDDAWWDFDGNLAGRWAAPARIMRVIGMTPPVELEF